VARQGAARDAASVSGYYLYSNEPRKQLVCKQKRFYRATLCYAVYAVVMCPSVRQSFRLSVRTSRAGIVPKRLNVGIGQNSNGVTPVEVPNKGGVGSNDIFRPRSRYILELFMQVEYIKCYLSDDKLPCAIWSYDHKVE